MSLMSIATDLKSKLRLKEGHLEPAFENGVQIGNPSVFRLVLGHTALFVAAFGLHY
jgi:hypothetical protein